VVAVELITEATVIVTGATVRLDCHTVGEAATKDEEPPIKVIIVGCEAAIIYPLTVLSESHLYFFLQSQFGCRALSHIGLSVCRFPKGTQASPHLSRQWARGFYPRSPLSVARYRTIVESHIIPGLGAVELRALTGRMIDKLYAGLRENGRRYGGGLSATTLRHVHTMLTQPLSSAVKAKEIARSPLADIQTTPKPKRAGIEILDETELATLIERLRGLPPLHADIDRGIYRPAAWRGSWAEVARCRSRERDIASQSGC
jgi:hypothetical protein